MLNSDYKKPLKVLQEKFHRLLPFLQKQAKFPTAETMSALTMPGTPKRVVDYSKLQESLLLEAAGQDPLKFLELQATMAKAGKKNLNR